MYLLREWNGTTRHHTKWRFGEKAFMRYSVSEISFGGMTSSYHSFHFSVVPSVELLEFVVAAAKFPISFCILHAHSLTHRRRGLPGSGLPFHPCFPARLSRPGSGAKGPRSGWDIHRARGGHSRKASTGHKRNTSSAFGRPRCRYCLGFQSPCSYTIKYPVHSLQ